MLCSAVVALSVGVFPARADGRSGAALGLAAKALTANAPANAIPGYYNLSAANLQKWRVAIAKMQLPGSTTHPKLLVIGDSLCAGAGAGVTDAFRYTNAYTKSWPVEMAAILTAAGVPAQTDSWFGPRSNTVSAAAYDPRITGATSWASLGSFPSLGGNELHTTVSNNALTFTPVGQFDTVQSLYLQQPASATFTVDVDGGAALATVNAVGANAMVFNTISGITLGTHAINTKTTTTGDFYLIGQIAYNSTVPSVLVMNACFGGATSANWASTSQFFMGANAVAAMAPDLTIVMLGANDRNTSVDVATFQTNMQTIITKAKLSGDVILVHEQPGDPASGYGNRTAMLQEEAALLALSTSNSVPMVDLDVRWGGAYANLQAVGFNFDQIHLNNYQDHAAAVAKAVLFPLR